MLDSINQACGNTMPDQVLDRTGQVPCPRTVEIILLAPDHSLLKSIICV